MPAKSAKQYKFMQAVLHGGSNKGFDAGPSKKVAKEFVDKTPKTDRSKFMKKVGKRN
jgi:hypothetical protein